MPSEEQTRHTTLETLIPDFQGIDKATIDRIIATCSSRSGLSHNLETVRRLTREVRIQAKYDRSLAVLKYLKDNGQRRTKSGIDAGPRRNRGRSDSNLDTTSPKQKLDWM